MLEIEKKVSLKDFATLKIGGEALFLARIKNKNDIREAFEFAKTNKISTFVLGGGSNVLFNEKGFDGLVLKMENKGVEFLLNENFIEVVASAGESWDDLVKMSVEKGFWGLENLSGIPGTVGASVVQNIGAYGSEVKDSVFRVEVFDPKISDFKFLSNKECGFGYRDSYFKKEKDLVVTRVFFRLRKNPNPLILYKDVYNLLGREKNPSIEKIRETILAIRSKKFPDINQIGTAGSFFKNIIITKDIFNNLKEKFPDIVSFDISENEKKISSAFILDKILNLKGFREGDVGLYENQPLVLVNFGKATSEDIKKFSEKIKNKVKEKTNLMMEEEVIIL